MAGLEPASLKRTITPCCCSATLYTERPSHWATRQSIQSSHIREAAELWKTVFCNTAQWRFIRFVKLSCIFSAPLCLSCLLGRFKSVLHTRSWAVRRRLSPFVQMANVFVNTPRQSKRHLFVQVVSLACGLVAFPHFFWQR